MTRGPLLIQFDEPNAATSQVQSIPLTGKPSFGFSRELGSFFEIDAGQQVDVDSNGSIAGTLVLTRSEFGYDNR